MFGVILVVLVYLTNLYELRGPHHPHGSKIVKYHTHYRPKREESVKITQDEDLLHDTEHLQEHLEDEIKSPDLTNMTDEELEFYYFHVHDVDKNSKLDGLEILQAIYHTSHDEDNKEDEDDINQFSYYVELIDKVLKEDDTDSDGYLSYPEYVEGRKKDAKEELDNINKKSRISVSAIETFLPIENNNIN